MFPTDVSNMWKYVRFRPGFRSWLEERADRQPLVRTFRGCVFACSMSAGVGLGNGCKKSIRKMVRGTVSAFDVLYELRLVCLSRNTCKSEEIGNLSQTISTHPLKTRK